MSDLLSRLQQFDSDYEKAPAEGAKVDLPPGKYVLSIKEGEVFESKDGRLYLRLDLATNEGAVVSKLYSLDNPERLPWLKKDMFNIGVMVQKLSELPGQIEKVKGLTVNVEVKQNGKFTNYYLNGRAIVKADDNKDVPF